ncbi:MAG: hypothetical protein NW208_05645 [Bryobacter sp.]|nr:hypothetical protein [Bryobacter sp.]
MNQKFLMIATAATACLLGSLLVAQTPKKGAGMKGGILQPQMAVEKGSYEVPMGKLGEAVAAGEEWSATTFGAAVDGKPNPGAKPMTVVGEILDFSCYMQIGKHGEKHRACAQKCFQAGQPIGLLAKDGTMYMLMEEEHDLRRDGLTNFRQAAVDHAAHIMEVTGTAWEHKGVKALYVHGYVKK